MSGLLGQIKAANEELRPNACPIHRILNDLDKQDRADLEAALADDSLMHVAIAKALISRGFDIGAHGKSISVHRRGQCGCSRR